MILPSIQSRKKDEQLPSIFTLGYGSNQIVDQSAKLLVRVIH